MSERVDVVLDVYSDEGGDTRVVMVGVFRPDEPTPPLPEGATRNRVHTWIGVEHNVRAFRIGAERG